MLKARRQKKRMEMVQALKRMSKKSESRRPLIRFRRKTKTLTHHSPDLSKP